MNDYNIPGIGKKSKIYLFHPLRKRQWMKPYSFSIEFYFDINIYYIEMYKTEIYLLPRKQELDEQKIC